MNLSQSPFRFASASSGGISLLAPLQSITFSSPAPARRKTILKGRFALMIGGIILLSGLCVETIRCTPNALPSWAILIIPFSASFREKVLFEIS